MSIQSIKDNAVREFEEKVAQLDNPYYLDNADGEVAEFGYKTQTDSGWIYTIPDWGNVKLFLLKTLTHIEAATREEVEEECEKCATDNRAEGAAAERASYCQRCLGSVAAEGKCDIHDGV